MKIKLINKINEFDLSLNTTKEHLVVEHDLDDSLIQIYLDAAIEHVESETRRSLYLGRYEVTVPRFEGVEPVRLSLPPIRAISNITYMDSGRAVTDLSADDYGVDLDSEFAYLVPDGCWPVGTNMKMTVLAGYGAMGTAIADLPAITFTNEYGPDIAIPQKLKLAVLMLVAHWYTHREATIAMTVNKVPLGVNALLMQYRNYKI